MGTEQGSNEIIHYLPQEISALGMTVHMQTLYMMWLTMAIVVILMGLCASRSKLIPGRFQCIVEMCILWLEDLIESNIGKEGRRVMAPFLITLFLYIFIGNEVGLMPQVGIHLTSPTNDINVVFGLSIMVMVVTYLMGFKVKGFGYLKHFVSPFAVMLPLNIVEEVVKPVTMALRLFGNILAGEILLIVLYQLLPWVAPVVWVLFSLCIGLLQAFVFTILTIIGLSNVFVEH